MSAFRRARLGIGMTSLAIVFLFLVAMFGRG